MNAPPTLSVLIHNLNRAEHLRRCLASVGSQALRPMEVVVLDAGSTDGSLEVVRAFRRETVAGGMRVVTVPCRLMGVAASRNLASRHAGGDLLCFLDNDGCLDDPEGLKRMVRAFEAQPRLGALTFRILLADTDAIDPFAWVHRRPVRPWAERRFKTFTFTGGGFCIRAAAFREAGGFWDRLEYAREEEELGLALIDRGWELVYAPEVVFRHYAERRGRMDTRRRRYVELRNGLMVSFRRLPLPVAAAAMLGRIATMSLRRLLKEGGRPWDLLAAVPDACREWRRGGGSRRIPISYPSTLKYAALQWRRAVTAPEDA